MHLLLHNLMKTLLKPRHFGISATLLGFPFLAFSQFTGGTVACDSNGSGLLGSDFSCTIYRIIDIISLLNPILFALSFLVFFWGVSKFILNSGSSIEVTKGKNYMIWGVVALFILISIQTIISIIVTDLDFGNGRVIPLIPTQQSSSQNTNGFNLPQNVP